MTWRKASVVVAVVVATAIVALVGACTADRIGAPRLRPDSTLVRNWTQPDNLTAELTANAGNGGGETSGSLGDYPVDTKLYLIASGYVVRHDNYISELSGNLGPGQSVGVILRRADGTTTSLTFPANGGQVADTQRVLISHGQSLLKAVRNGENPTTRNGVYWNGQYIWCSPSSNPPCVTYSGGHTIQVVTIPASYQASADSNMYSIGSWAEFRLTATPDSIWGDNVPIQIDSAIWSPAPDSVGGNSNPDDSATVSGCLDFRYISPADHSKTIYRCSRLIQGAGTMTFIAHANGFRQQSQPVQINVRDKRLNLTPSRAAVHPGDTVKFTPSYSDGSTPSPFWWQWFPDTPPNQMGGDCAHTAATCTKPIPQNGTMKVWVWKGNIKRAASAHVTVYTTFSLVADSTTVHSQSNVRFTPQTDGKTARAARWRWAPHDTTVHDSTTCTSDTTCVKAMVTTGTMWAYLASSGGDSASVGVTVVDPSVHLTIDRNSIGEGDTVSLQGTIAPANAGYQVVGWSFQPDVFAGGVIASRVPKTAASLPLNAKTPVAPKLQTVGDTILTTADTTAGDSLVGAFDTGTELPPIDDRPLTIACDNSSLHCQTPVFRAGTITLAVNIGGTVYTSNAVHVELNYVCPQIFPEPLPPNEITGISQVPPDPIVTNKEEKTWYGRHIGYYNVWVTGPYEYRKRIEINESGIPIGAYIPGYAKDDGGRVIFVRPWSTIEFQCRVKINPNTLALEGKMIYNNHLSIWWYAPMVPQ